MKLVFVMFVSLTICTSTTTVLAYRDLCSIDEEEYMRDPIEILVQIKSYCTTMKIIKFINDSSEISTEQKTAEDDGCTFETLSELTSEDQTNQLARCIKRNLAIKSGFNICNLTEAIGFSAEKLYNSEVARNTKCGEKINPYESSPNVKQCIMKMILGDLIEYLEYEPKSGDLCSKELISKI